jgi:guanylate kinase
MIMDNELLEFAEYVDNYYGTSLKAIQDRLNAGIDVLLDIEVQGAAKVRARCPDALFIFIIPPSFEELSRRLFGRNTDNEETIMGRLEKARVEFREIPNYDYLVINDKVSNAVQEIEAILTAAECRVENRSQILAQFE